jgi:hypothetical protein
MTLPMAIVAPVAYTVYTLGKQAASGPAGRADAFWAISGWNGDKMDLSKLPQTYGPIFMGFVLHWAAGKFGINKMLGRAKIPIIRI